jgi:hypothetical protein
MSMSLFQTVLTVALLLPFFTVPFAPTPRQSVKQGSASVTINPPEATIHVGQTQTFEAVVKGYSQHWNTMGGRRAQRRAHNRRWNLYSSPTCGPLSRRCD